MHRLILGILFSVSTSFATTDCPTVDLTKEPPLSNRKHYDQADTLWCCSFSLVDSISMKYGKNYSPVDIALIQAHAKRSFGECNSLSEIPDAINRSEGLCTEENYTKAILDLEKAGSQNDEEKAAYLKDFLENHSYSFEIATLKKNFEVAKINAGYLEMFCQADLTRRSSIFRNLRSIRDLGTVAKETIQKDYFDYIYALNLKNCSDRDKVKLNYRHLEVGQKNSEFGSSDSSLQSELTQNLIEKNPPVLIVAIQSLFKPLNTGGIKGPLTKTLDYFAGSHAVNLVGLRKVGNKCYYKVRDSALPKGACAKYKKSENILCPPTGEHDGTYEVEAEEFNRTIRRAMALQ